jgi:Fic family protein
MGDMMKEQCFRDGNKRTALIFANTFLLQKNIGYIRIDDKQKYIDNLLDYYENKISVSQFVDFVKKEFYISAKYLMSNNELVSNNDLKKFNSNQTKPKTKTLKK